MTVAVSLAIEPGAIAADPADFDPEQGAVVDGAYLNPYFGIRYPLPAGWKPGPQPARPSYGGYYALSTPLPPKDTKATILIAAQDTFFADKLIGDAKAALVDLAHGVQEDDTAEAGISSTTIAGHTFARLDIEASPLSRVVFATNIRCHAVIFAFTSADRAGWLNSRPVSGACRSRQLRPRRSGATAEHHGCLGAVANPALPQERTCRRKRDRAHL